MKYVIHSKSEQGFWSNKTGWVHCICDACFFNQNEITYVTLPLSQLGDAEWMVYDYGEE